MEPNSARTPPYRLNCAKRDATFMKPPGAFRKSHFTDATTYTYIEYKVTPEGCTLESAAVMRDGQERSREYTISYEGKGIIKGAR